VNSSEINQLFSNAIAKQRYHLLEEELVDLIASSGIKTSLESNLTNDGYLLRIKNTREFGMIIQAGVGGKNAELYTQCFRKGQALISSSTAMLDSATFLKLFKQTLAYKKLNESFADNSEIGIDKTLTTLFSNFIEIANQFSPDNTDASYVIDELEINPLVTIDGKLVATNCKCSFINSIQARAPRPNSNIDHMLHPASIGIIGVSASKMNFGRIILKNVLASGYDKSKMVIIRPDEEEIDGVRCVEDLQSLDQKLDLFIVAIGADSVYSLVDEIIEANAAEGVMLIPGGLGETEASREPVGLMVERIEKAHRNNENTPVFIGGNCLGIVSHPGGYDTWFIPVEKLPKTRKKDLRNSAFVSQSGAFMITRLSKNPWIDPSYMIAVGNQNDLGHGDMLNYFAEHEEIDVIGFYIEGFKDLDGLAFARAARRAVLKGKQVIVYKAGQTSVGEEATLGHTASISGDFTLCESILEQAGVMVCSDFGDFSDLFYLAPLLHKKTFNGNRIGAVSGAGFETVGMADGLSTDDYSMQMAQLDSTTIKQLEDILIAKKLDALMEVRNPLDINPGADDEAHLQCVEALAADPNVDAIIVGLDPLSPMTKTLEKSARPGFDIYAEDSAVQQYPALVASIEKPVIGIVEGGKMYDAMIEKLMDQGVCIFRSCEQGMRALVKYTQARIRADEIRNSEKQV
jgi:acetate---CoA ligase (ADP-forming)